MANAKEEYKLCVKEYLINYLTATFNNAEPNLTDREYKLLLTRQKAFLLYALTHSVSKEDLWTDLNAQNKFSELKYFNANYTHEKWKNLRNEAVKIISEFSDYGVILNNK